MKSVGLVYRLLSCNDARDGELVEVCISESGRFESIIVDGKDLTGASAEELMRSLISQRNLTKIVEKEFESVNKERTS